MVRPKAAPDVLIAAAVILLLCSPALFTNSGFIDDWVDHLWLSWMQSREIAATGHPSLFFNAEPMGVFYPNFAFYGGTLYAIAGYMSVITGSPVAVFVGMIVAAFMSAYGSTFWIARDAGVPRLAAHLPALVLVSGAYYLSLAYGRGSWPELLATSAIPLILASAIRIVRRGTSVPSVSLLIVATVIWSGSHNITLMWGAMFIAAVGAALLIAFAPVLTIVHGQRLAAVGGVVIVSVMVNGWFLFVDLSYGLHTEVASFRAISGAISGLFSRASIVFDPLRARATDATYLRSHFTELPVLALVWLGVVVAATRLRDWTVPVRRAFAILGALLAVLIVLLLDESVWTKLPSVLSVIQFTFRLETYIVMAIVGLLILALTMVSRMQGAWRKAMLSALAAISIFNVALGVWQVWNSNAWYYPYSPRYLANRASVLRFTDHTPPTWYETGQLREIADQIVPTEGTVRLDPRAIHGDSTTQDVRVPPGEGPVASNIAASGNLVSVRGLRIAGRTANGFLALERPSDGRTLVRLTVALADTTPIQLGPIISVLGLIGAITSLVWAAVIPRRRQRTGRRDTARGLRRALW
jgi:hypothetical protein